MSTEPNEQTALNTDRELWRKIPGDYYSDSLHVTIGGGIGMNVGGHVIVLPLELWFAAAKKELVKATRREGESAPAQPKRVLVVDTPLARQAVDTAMTAEQELEQSFSEWYKANYLTIAGTSSWVERAKASYMAGAAHVREAAQSNTAVNRELSDLREKWNAAERKLAESRETSRELNRRNGALQHTLNTITDRNVWYGYYNAALSLFGWEEDKRKTAERKLAELEKALRSWPAEYDSQDRMVMRFTRKEWYKLLASLRAYPLHMTDPIVEKAANGEECEHCHTPLAVLNGLLVHRVTLSRACPTAGNLTGRTKTVASLRAESKEG